MSALWHFAIGLGLATVGWRAPRRVAGARGRGWTAVLDAAPLAVVTAVLLLASGRPMFAGVAALALGGGFAFADRTVRDTLREPIVFSALSELPHVFTHPHLYLPFAGTGTVIAAMLAAVAVGVALLVAEPPPIPPHPFLALAAAVAVAAALRVLGREPWLGRAARTLRRLRPSGEPFADAVRLSPVAMLIAHGLIARSERPARRSQLAPRSAGATTASDASPIVLVQCESFF
ncbi:MAG: hypothetical protein JO258_21130, partial [Alphaproteobacteria bacterium]|nr:hypothetical protein [Alphaproteobacteria bacterium]